MISLHTPLPQRIRSHMFAITQEVINQVGLMFTCEEITSIEGVFTLIRDQATNEAVCLLETIEPWQSAFDEQARDTARAVASRMRIPMFVVCSLRNFVVYNTDAVTKRLPDEQQVLHVINGADIVDITAVRVGSALLAVNTAVKEVLEFLQQPSRETQLAHVFLSQRIIHALTELLHCTNGLAPQRSSAIRIGTSIVAYVLMQLRNPVLDALSIPYGVRSASLALDIVGAYFREARKRGNTMMPESVADLQVVPTHELLFRSVLADLVLLLNRFDVDRLPETDLHHAVDTVLTWCAQNQQTSVPTIEAIDVVLRALVHRNPKAGLAPEPILEVGSTMGAFGIRMSALYKIQPNRYVYAANADEERLIVMRASGRLDAPSDVRLLRKHETVTKAWGGICITATNLEERHRVKLLLRNLPITPSGFVVLFLPAMALRSEHYAAVRTALAARFTLQWIITSDAEPLAQPNSGICCIVATALPTEQAATCVYIRKPLADFFIPTENIRSAHDNRTKRIDDFIRYLDASERGKLNDEAMVRMVPQEILRSIDNWEGFVMPPDILASILRKTQHRLVPMKSIADVAGGLRTGANDVFMPDMTAIATEDLEQQYWQRVLPDGSIVDNTVITGVADIPSICGVPASDRRLLIMPPNRAELHNTHVQERLLAAERDNVHLRAAVRSRNPWHAVELPPTATFIIPKNLDGTWIVANNISKAIAADACIAVSLKNPAHADAQALWLNSTLGIMMHLMLQHTSHAADVSVRDAQEMLVLNDEDVLLIDTQKHSAFLRRPITPLYAELGAESEDIVSTDTVLRDRRKLDQHIMSGIFGFTEEEQRWVYRYTLAWWNNASNIRHVTLALVSELERTTRLRPLSAWYTPILQQLPDEHRKIVLLPYNIDSARVKQTMFSWQAELLHGTKVIDVLECSSPEEARIIALFAELGKLHIELPSDVLMMQSVLPELEQFSEGLRKGLNHITAMLPADLHETIRTEVLRAMVVL